MRTLPTWPSGSQAMSVIWTAVELAADTCGTSRTAASRMRSSCRGMLAMLIMRVYYEHTRRALRTVRRERKSAPAHEPGRLLDGNSYRPTKLFLSGGPGSVYSSSASPPLWSATCTGLIPLQGSKNTKSVACGLWSVKGAAASPSNLIPKTPHAHSTTHRCGHAQRSREDIGDAGGAPRAAPPGPDGATVQGRSRFSRSRAAHPGGGWWRAFANFAQPGYLAATSCHCRRTVRARGRRRGHRGHRGHDGTLRRRGRPDGRRLDC